MKKIVKKFVVLILFLFFVLIGLLTIRSYQHLKNVNHYRPLVAQAAEKYDLSEYENLVLAIIYTESKGKSIDLMQSSESVYGERNRFSSPEESIEYGVRHLAQAIEKSNEAGCDIWTAVQSYNYGLEYIEYVAKNGKKNSVVLAENYSRDVLAPLLGNEQQEKYRYLGVRPFIHNGGFLYLNGGNFFYADIVKGNLTKLQLTEKIFK